jgi:hypothetical protein
MRLLNRLPATGRPEKTLAWKSQRGSRAGDSGAPFYRPPNDSDTMANLH